MYVGTFASNVRVKKTSANCNDINDDTMWHVRPVAWWWWWWWSMPWREERFKVCTSRVWQLEGRNQNLWPFVELKWKSGHDFTFAECNHLLAQCRIQSAGDNNIKMTWKLKTFLTLLTFKFIWALLMFVSGQKYLLNCPSHIFYR